MDNEKKLIRAAQDSFVHDALLWILTDEARRLKTYQGSILRGVDYLVQLLRCCGGVVPDLRFVRRVAAAKRRALTDIKYRKRADARLRRKIEANRRTQMLKQCLRMSQWRKELNTQGGLTGPWKWPKSKETQLKEVGWVRM